MKRYLLKQLRRLTIWLNNYFGDDVSLLHFKSDNGKYIYLVMLGHHCPDKEKFKKIFPNSTQISEGAFNVLHKKGIEIVVVGDKADIDRLEATKVPAPTLKVHQ